jgi:cytochrome c
MSFLIRRSPLSLWIVLLVCFTVALVSGSSFARPANPQRSGQSNAIERGKYLVETAGCHDCHTPYKNGQPDMTHMLMGHPQDIKIAAPAKVPAPWSMAATDTNTAWSGPWGVSFSTNLTPDRDTGLGAWNEQIFVNTIRSGKHAGTGREILPPMPWQGYARLTDDDLKAIFAYLKSVPAISNRVPAPIPPAR